MTGRRTALIVACGRYEHPGLRRLAGPSADAQALREVLADPAVGGFEVRVLEDGPAHLVAAAVEDVLTEAQTDDTVLLHFSGHGLKSDSGELYFAASTTRPDRLASTAVPADFVDRAMHVSRSRRIVLFLDCCYGGAFSRGLARRSTERADVLESFAATGAGAGRGRAVITASNAMEYAFEDGSLADDQTARPSVFTAALVAGLVSGDADRDGDGWVSLGELYDYVFDQVRAVSPHQTPSRDFRTEGDFAVARSPRGPATPPVVVDHDREHSEPGPAPASGRDGAGTVSAVLAIGAALLMAVATLDHWPGLSVIEWGGSLSAYLVPVYALSALSLTAGVLMARNRTRDVTGAGLLVGLGVAGSHLLLALGTYPFVAGTDLVGTGMVLLVLGHGLLAAAAAVALVSRLRRRTVTLAVRHGPTGHGWLLLTTGTLAGVTLAVRTDDYVRHGWEDWVTTATAWSAVTVLALAYCAAVARPRAFGAALLLGWCTGGAVVGVGLVVLDDVTSQAPGPTVAFLVAVGLSVAASTLSWRASRRDATRPAPAP